MNNLLKFNYEENEINVLLSTESNQFLFDASHICDILEYQNPSDVITKLDDDEKFLLARTLFDPSFTLGSPGPQKKWFVNEAGLYSLILRSEMPRAREFKRWVTHEVLPTLHRTGHYSMPSHDLLRIAEAFEAARKIARTAGKRGQKGIRLADEMIRREYGVSPLHLLGYDRKKLKPPEGYTQEYFMERAKQNGTLQSIPSGRRASIKEEFKKYKETRKQNKIRKTLDRFKKEGRSWRDAYRYAHMDRRPPEEILQWKQFYQELHVENLPVVKKPETERQSAFFE